MKIVYCDCFSGISGDMFLSSMIDAGLPEELLQEQLERLGIDDKFQIKTKNTQKGSFVARELEIQILSKGKTHHHEHNHFSQIKRIIEESGLNSNIRSISLDIFTHLAEAEAHVYGTTIDEVHFHGVGAIDSIIDIVGSAIALDYFNIEKLYSSSLPLTSGSIMTQHGLLPLPTPTTALLLKNMQAPLRSSDSDKELITPTGAAILSSMAIFDKPEFKLISMGVGAGKLELPWPNILRIFIGEVEEAKSISYVQLETNIDDMNPEVYQPVMKKLFEAGALDVFFTPIIMKKNRPAVKISVIGFSENEQQFSQILLEHTSTFGVRVQPIHRHEAIRGMKTVKTKFGDVPVKMKFIDNIVRQISPEFQDCTDLADKANVPSITVYQSALAAGEKLIGKTREALLPDG